MLFTKIIRGIAAGALALAALGAHAHTVQNTPLEKFSEQSATCTLAQEAQVIDAPEEIASLYGECASGATINPYKYTDPDGRFAFLIPMAAGAIIGGGINFGAQMIRSGGDISRVSWGQVGVAAAGGALAGGAGVIASTASTTAGMIGANAVAGSSISAVGAHAAAAVDGKTASTADVTRAAALGGAASVAAAAITAVPAGMAAASQMPGTAMQAGERNIVEGIRQTTASTGKQVNYAPPAGQAVANRAGDVVSNSTNVEQQPKEKQ